MVTCFIFPPYSPLKGGEFMTDKEIALELTKIYVEHLNKQMDNKHQHTDLDFKAFGNVYSNLYQLVHLIDNSDEGK